MCRSGSARELRQGSSAVEQGTHKPLVGSSILPLATTREAGSAPEGPPARALRPLTTLSAMSIPSSLSAGLGNGQTTPPEPPRRLRAGPWQVDLIEGELRYLSVGGDEAVRRIYAAVRDRDWNTVPGERSALEVVEEAGGFDVTWRSEHVDGAVDFVWESRIVGSADGVLTWMFDGVARRAFPKNRVGFCVLHPLATCTGQACAVEHVNGDWAARVFPQGIAPDQPVRGLHDFRRMRYGVNAAWDVELTFDGDSFEMEDQRNWTDASFKTYSTPQRIPLPAWLREGQRVRQVVMVRLVAKGGALKKDLKEAKEEAARVELAGEAVMPLPLLGLGSPWHGKAMSGREEARLQALRLDHLRVDVKTSEVGWQAVLQQGVEEARRMGAALEVALHVAGPAAAALAAEAKALTGAVARWLVLEEGRPVASAAVLQAVRPALGQGLGAGTDVDFFQLNNNRPARDQADFIFCAMRPQAHAFDDASVVENLEGQAQVVATSREVFGELPVVASPVTLKRRWHKGAPRPAGELPPPVDRRQLSLLGAGWLVGSLRALAQAGAAAVTWFETTGWRGVMEVEEGAPLPGEFPSEPGAVFPMYHVLRAVADFHGGGLRPLHLSHPLKVQAVALEADGRQRWVVANVTGLPQRVALPAGGAWRILDEAAARRCGQDPELFWASPTEERAAGEYELAPWALVFLDVA